MMINRIAREKRKIRKQVCTDHKCVVISHFIFFIASSSTLCCYLFYAVDYVLLFVEPAGLRKIDDNG